MKVIFLYHDYAYNWAIIRTAKKLKDFGIQMQCQKIASIEDAKAIGTNCDLLLINPRYFYEELKVSKIPVAVVSDVDGGWVSPHIHLLPYVKGFIESYSYLPRTLHNRPYYNYNMKLLRLAGFERKTEVPNAFPINSFSEEELNSKIHTYCGFCSWERIKDIINLEVPSDVLGRERPSSIFFAGWMDYAGTEVEQHRKAAVDICNKVGGLGIAGRVVQWPEYRRKLLSTKMILSPWGWGEACHRDAEALAFGAVLVKPQWDFVESYPDCSSTTAPYIPCKLDFSDVPEIVENVYKHWESYYLMRRRGLELIKDALDTNKITKRLVEIFECLMK